MLETVSLDKALNEKDVVSDAPYILAKTSNGDTVKISKADLASVVAGQMFDTASKLTGETFVNDMNNVANNQYCGLIGESTQNSPISGVYGTFLYIGSQQIASVYTSYATVKTYVRGRSLDGKFWSPWKEV